MEETEPASGRYLLLVLEISPQIVAFQEAYRILWNSADYGCILTSGTSNSVGEGREIQLRGEEFFLLMAILAEMQRFCESQAQVR